MIRPIRITVTVRLMLLVFCFTCVSFAHSAQKISAEKLMRIALTKI
ncbi:MAG: hypothetical protein KKD44_20990 [Proteobacteria bacterium]|nr:hypothetical protein [Pseudomonadota bacterium]